MSHLSFWSNITNSYWYLDKEVYDQEVGRNGKVVMIKPLNITESVKIRFDNGNRKVYIKEKLLSLIQK